MILDDKRNPFYWHTNEARHINFNLPPGTYYTENDLHKRAKFKPYGHEPYPKLNKAFLRRVKVFPYKNPSKASISLQKAFILADPAFYYSKYKPLKTFTLCHEVFHTVYHAKNRRERNNFYIHEYIEMQCDNAAKAFMLANGWNPTQISLAVKMLLRGKHRRECIRQNTTAPKNGFRR